MKRFRNLAVLLATALLLFTWGFLTAQRQIFPADQLRTVREWVSGKNRLDERTIEWDERVALFSKSEATAEVVMVGDSRTAWAAWPDLLSTHNVLNRGIGGDTTTGILKRMPSIISTRAKVAFLAVGINDLLRGASPERVLENHQKIIKTLHEAGMFVVITSVVRCNLQQYERPCKDINEKILLLNRELSQWRLPGTRFFDLDAAMSDPQQGLKAALSTDGLHFTMAGYHIWAQLVRQQLQEVSTQAEFAR